MRGLAAQLPCQTRTRGDAAPRRASATGFQAELQTPEPGGGDKQRDDDGLGVLLRKTGSVSTPGGTAQSRGRHSGRGTEMAPQPSTSLPASRPTGEAGPGGKGQVHCEDVACGREAGPAQRGGPGWRHCPPGS